MPFEDKDRQILRELAKQIAEIGNHPRQARLRAMWKLHNSLKKTKPMVLVSPEGSWGEIFPEGTLRCTDPLARAYENHFRSLIYRWEHLRDDWVILPHLKVGLTWTHTGWGLAPGYTHSDMPRGAWHIEPPMKDESDLEKLKVPDIVIDEEATQRNFEMMHDAVGDILEVKIYHRMFIWGFTGLANVYMYLRGLDQMMYDMIERPEFVHRVMKFLADGNMHMLDQVDAYPRLDLDNDDEYIASGGIGFTDELPGPDFDGRVRLRNLWGFGEAQELVGVSGAMHEEFVFQYQRPLMDRFGLNCYGCCEPVTDRLEYVLKIPRLRRISISPWADKRLAAEGLGDKYIFSWKPNPAQMCGKFDEDWIRRDIRETLDIAKGCVVEMILKDTHTCDNDPSRLSAWVRIAEEETGGLD